MTATAMAAGADSAERRARVAIYLKTVGVALAYVFGVWLLDRVYVGHHVPDRQLSLALSFTLLQILAIFTLLGISFAIKHVRHARESRGERHRPAIREKLTRHLAGTDYWAALRRFHKIHPRDFEQCLADLLSSVNGAGRDRLSQAAVELGMPAQWEKQYRSRDAGQRREAISRIGLVAGRANPTLLDALADPDDFVKLEASRALIRSGERRDIARVFRMASGQSLFVRVLLTEALRPHALALAERAIPEALASADPKQVVAALEIVKAWGKSLPLPDLSRWLGHPDAAVRAAALRVVPLAGMPPETEEQVLRRLEDEDAGVRTVAANISGKMRMSLALLLLKRCLRQTSPETVLAAAYALAELGPKGCKLLENEVLAGHPASASAALEALERVKLNRLVMAGI